MWLREGAVQFCCIECAAFINIISQSVAFRFRNKTLSANGEIAYVENVGKDIIVCYAFPLESLSNQRFCLSASDSSVSDSSNLSFQQ